MSRFKGLSEAGDNYDQPLQLDPVYQSDAFDGRRSGLLWLGLSFLFLPYDLSGPTISLSFTPHASFDHWSGRGGRSLAFGLSHVEEAGRVFRVTHNSAAISICHHNAASALALGPPYW